MNRNVFILLIFTMLSCSSNRYLTGTYASRNSPYSFSINSDSTFDFRYKFQFAYQYSSGVWREVSKNKIILNSEFKNRIIPLQVFESKNKNEVNGISISINSNISKEERVYYKCLVIVDNKLELEKSCDSLSDLLISKYSSNILLKVTGDSRIPSRFLDTLTTETYLIKDKMSNNLRINMLYNDSLFNYRVFNDEILKFNNKGVKFKSLILPIWKGELDK